MHTPRPYKSTAQCEYLQCESLFIAGRSVWAPSCKCAPSDCKSHRADRPLAKGGEFRSLLEFNAISSCPTAVQQSMVTSCSCRKPHIKIYDVPSCFQQPVGCLLRCQQLHLRRILLFSSDDGINSTSADRDSDAACGEGPSVHQYITPLVPVNHWLPVQQQSLAVVS